MTLSIKEAGILDQLIQVRDKAVTDACPLGMNQWDAEVVEAVKAITTRAVNQAIEQTLAVLDDTGFFTACHDAGMVGVLDPTLAGQWADAINT